MMMQLENGMTRYAIVPIVTLSVSCAPKGDYYSDKVHVGNYWHNCEFGSYYSCKSTSAG